MRPGRFLFFAADDADRAAAMSQGTHPVRGAR